MAPFKAAMQALAEGKNTDQNTLDLMVNVVSSSLEEALGPF